MQHPDHRHTQATKLCRQLVDRLDDVARSRHLGRSARRAECGLHVDDGQRRAGGIQPVEHMVAAAPLKHAIDDLLADADGVHERGQPGQGLRQSSPARSLTGPIVLSKRMVMRSSRL